MDHTTFVAVSQYGRLFTRSTKTMEYTHAVLATYANGHEEARSWHKTKAAAERAAVKVVGRQIVELIALPYNSTEAKQYRAGSEPR